MKLSAISGQHRRRRALVVPIANSRKLNAESCSLIATMPVMENLRVLTRVRISGAAGVCVGRIEDIRPIDEMPDITGFALGGDFAPVQILRDMGVARCALISYFATDHDEVMFVAMEIDGAWYDLQRQALTLEVIGQARMM